MLPSSTSFKGFRRSCSSSSNLGPTEKKVYATKAEAQPDQSLLVEPTSNPVVMDGSNKENETSRIPSCAQHSQVNKKSKPASRPLGLVRFVNGHMEYREVNENVWKAAIYHEELRDALIAKASLLGEYDHPRECGVATNDITSYLPSQKEWGPDRQVDWPKIKENVLHRFERDNYPIPEYTPAVWYDDGRIVLDANNHPLLEYEILPATLSSELSGRDMEAMKRLDLRISHSDFRARMPSTVLKKGKKKNWVKGPLCTLSAIAMRTARFREDNGLILWIGREGSKRNRSNALKRMSQAAIAANSTQGISVPALFEQKNSRTSNQGKHPARADRRSRSVNTRREQAHKESERLESRQVDGTQNGLKRKRNEGLLEDEQDLQEAKRLKEDATLSTSQPTSAPDLPPQPPHSLSFQYAPLESGLESYLAPRTIGFKRSHDEVFSNEGPDHEGPSKRHKAQTVFDQPAARPIERNKALPRPFHRRVGCRDDDMASRKEVLPAVDAVTRASSTGLTFQAPQQIHHHHIEENRLDDLTTFAVEESHPDGRSVGRRLEEALEAYFATEQAKIDAAQMAHADNRAKFIIDDPNLSAIAPLIAQEIYGDVNFDPLPLSRSLALEDEGVNNGSPSSPLNLIPSTAELNSIVQAEEISSEGEIDPQDDRRTVPAVVWTPPAVPETEDDLFAMFVNEDAYE